MTDYRLYAHRNSYAMSTHLLLEELGVDYDVVWFNVHRRQEFPAEFLTLNPNGRVPVLVTPDGPVYESAATLMVLSERHDNRFMPAPGSESRAPALQWLFYLMSTFQPEVLIQFHPERYFPGDPAMQNSLRKASLRELERYWQVIDEQLDGKAFFLGESWTLCDMLFVTQALWRENQPARLGDFANARRWMLSAFERPAVRRTLAIHCVEHLTRLD